MASGTRGEHSVEDDNMTRTTRIAIKSYINGLTGSGLFRKLELPYQWSPSLIGKVDQKHDFRVAMSALTIGAIVNVMTLCAFVYLSVHNHERIAGCVLGLLSCRP